MKKRVYINASTAISPDGAKGEDGILHAVEPDYKNIITNANLRRRMSHIVKMGVACGLLCLQKNSSKPIDSIITATGLGCLEDTERFLNSIIENNERLLNPTAFTQSTFNVIGAQLALLTNNHGYNNTFVHRGLSFESALVDAIMRINEGDKNVLVGAIDEATSTTQTIMQKMGLLRDITMGEGAQFFILGNESNAAKSIEVKGVKTYTEKLTSSEIRQKIESFLNDVDVDKTDVHCLITGNNGNSYQDKIYADIQSLFKTAEKKTFKEICGEYPTASSYAFYMAASYMIGNSSENLNVLIYNRYNGINHSLILLGR